MGIESTNVWQNIFQNKSSCYLCIGTFRFDAVRLRWANFLWHCAAVKEDKVENDVFLSRLKPPTTSNSQLLSSTNADKTHVASTQIINSKWSKNTNFWEDNRKHFTFTWHHSTSYLQPLAYATPTARNIQHFTCSSPEYTTETKHLHLPAPPDIT